MRVRRTASLSAIAVLTSTLLTAAAPVASGETCSAKPPQGCTVDDFIEQAKATRANSGYKPLYAEDHVVARYGTLSAARAAARAHGSRVMRSIDKHGTVTLSVPKGMSAKAFAALLRKDPGIAYAELDPASKALSQTVDWGVTDMKAPAAHTNGFTGSGVIVAVLDTGVDYNHEDLAGNIWTNAGETPGNGLDDDANGFVDDVRGWDFAGNFFTATQPDNDPMDGFGHGTHVAGIIAAQDNSTGVLGVAPEATIMPVKVLDNTGSGWDSTIAEGIRYAVDNGAHVINMSLGGYGISGALADAVAYAAANDVAVVAASGNAFFYSLPSYPAGYASVISVSAAREGDHTKTWWSDWGHSDFIAPGNLILSTTPDDHYERFSGTSMAAPHVAGALALLKEAHPAFTATQLEQALGSTAGDVYFSGKDEVSGAGFPDVEAATGTLPAAQVQLYRSRYLIPANGSTPSVITVRILDENGDPIAGAEGDFSTDEGTLSVAPFTTDANGEATTELTADDEWGSATVTATPDAHPAASVRVIVEDDRVRLDDLTVAPVQDETVEPEPVDDASATSTTSGPEEPGGTPSTPTTILPGDDVIVRAFLGRHNFSFEDAKASVELSVTDPNGDPVPEMAATLDPVSVFGFGAQIMVSSMPMTVPEDAIEGAYTITGTVTTIKPGDNEDHVLTEKFTVGDDPNEILLVRSGFAFDTETLNYFWGHQNDSVIRRQLDELDRTYTYWEASLMGAPSLEEMAKHSIVIWLGGWDNDLPMDALTSYLEMGGNLLLSGEMYGGFARGSSTAAYRDFMHSIGLLTTYFPDDNNQIYPSSVSGSDGGLFDGQTLSLAPYDLNHRGESTALFTDEHVLNPADDAEALFEYADGVYDPALAGVTVDTGVYRVVNLGFGIESIEDPTEQQDALEAVIESFETAPDITSVTPVVDNSGLDFVTIEGTGFQAAGLTTVKIGAFEVPSTVFSREMILAEVPAGFPTGTYSVKVINPDGSSDTVASAVKVVYPAPVITKISPTFASNDRARRLRVFGNYFRPGAKVKVEGTWLSTSFVSSHEVRATIPSGFGPLGLANVRVTNTDGKTHLRQNVLLIRYGFTTTLSLGDSSPAVPHLQRRLRFYGFFPASQSTTSFFGSITRTSLIKYQKSRKLSATGVLDGPTRSKLNNEAGKEI